MFMNKALNHHIGPLLGIFYLQVLIWVILLGLVHHDRYWVLDHAHMRKKRPYAIYKDYWD